MNPPSSHIPVGGVVEGVISKVEGRGGRGSIACVVPSFSFFINSLLSGGVP